MARVAAAARVGRGRGRPAEGRGQQGGLPRIRRSTLGIPSRLRVSLGRPLSLDTGRTPGVPD
eukprot:15438382-Alexandrium_andersonii.AAC.1